jgi:hypothetical protein
MVKCLFVVNTRALKCPYKTNPDDSNLAWSVEAMQWALLYLSIGHDESISHSTAEMFRSSIMHVPHSTASGTASGTVADHLCSGCL